MRKIDIGTKIKELRKKKKITQKKLGEMTGIAEITIRQYEANKYKPKIEQLKKLCIALEIPLIELLELDENNLVELQKQDVHYLIESMIYIKEQEKLLNFDNEERHHLLIHHYDKLHRIGRDSLIEILANLKLLNEEGQKEASKRVAELTEIEKYKDSN